MEKERIKNKKNLNRGITLIALVITIIVLLILAGISIAMLTGENGILTKADKAREETERAEIIERVKLEILEYETENEGKITDDEAYGIIAQYDKDYNKNVDFEFKVNEEEEEYLTTKEGYDILVSEIWIATKKEETINFTVDGKALVAKKNETWIDWFIRMKDEPEEVIGLYCYTWEQRNDIKHINVEQEISFYDVYGLYAYLIDNATQKKIRYKEVIKPQRRVSLI